MTSQKDISRIIEGALLIAERTLLPEPSPQDSQSIGNGWACVTNNAVFEKKLSTAGWVFSYMAGTVRTRVFGFERQRMMQTAVKQLLAKVALQKCNCVEIDRILERSFWGMPSVIVLAHSRNIQEHGSFGGASA